MLGIIGRPSTTQFSGSDCKVYNCSFVNADSDAISMTGVNSTLENNEFRNIDFSCADLPGLMVSITVSADNANVLNNYIENTGASAMFKIGKGSIKYNRITNTGHLQHDGSMTQYTVNETNTAVVSYNWYHDGKKSGARFDCPNPPTRWGVNGTMHHNVCMNTGTGLLPKGNSHFIYSNTALDCGGQDIAIHDYADGSGATNDQTITRNNAAEKLSGIKGDKGYVPLPGTHSNNWNGFLTGLGLRTQLRDPDNWDFRPQAGSDLVDAGAVISGITDGHFGSAPDIGAYELGDTNYWIAGRKLYKASTPIPLNGTTSAKQDCDLMWLQALDAVSYDVYLSDDPVLDSSDFQGNQTNNIFTPPAIAPGLTHYWRVDAVTVDDTITGDVWSFRTQGILNQTVFTPIDDAHVDVDLPDSNFGSSTILDLKTPETGNITRQGYLKFDIPAYAGIVTNATLRLHTARTNPLQGGASVYGVSDTTWDEDTITWNDQPGIDGEIIASGEVPASNWGEFDVTSYIDGGGLYSFGLIRGVATSNRSVDSKDSIFPPELVIEYEVTGGDPPPAAPTNLGTTSGVGYIIINWDNNTEPYLQGYRLYRRQDPADNFTQIHSGLLTASDYIDRSMLPGLPYQYMAKAAGTFGQLSPESNIATATAIPEETNDPPTFDIDPINRLDTIEGAAYSGSIADTASDVDAGDTLTYSRAGGPSWLNVAADGTLSGIPDNNGVGEIPFTVRVEDEAGLYDEAQLNIKVFGSPNIDGIGSVNGVDFSMLAANWLNNTCTTPTWCDGADLDINGTVDIEDLKTLAASWLN
jgi:hypothetical protein